MKRFYKNADFTKVTGGFQIQLDGRAIKTALGNPQIAPTHALAVALAAEWNAQGEELDKALFRYRDHLDYAIDIVRPNRALTVGKLLRFIETDTLCYRADPGEHFFRRQQQLWDPLLQAFEQREAISLERISGIIHRSQPPAAVSRLAQRLEQFDNCTLTALFTMTSLAASLCIGMSALEEGANPDDLWNAANLEEDWQVEQWGEDFEATEVRRRRTADFHTAWDFLQLVKPQAV